MKKLWKNLFIKTADIFLEIFIHNLLFNFTHYSQLLLFKNSFLISKIKVFLSFQLINTYNSNNKYFIYRNI